MAHWLHNKDSSLTLIKHVRRVGYVMSVALCCLLNAGCRAGWAVAPPAPVAAAHVAPNTAGLRVYLESFRAYGYHERDIASGIADLEAAFREHLRGQVGIAEVVEDADAPVDLYLDVALVPRTPPTPGWWTSHQARALSRVHGSSKRTCDSAFSRSVTD